MNMSPEAKAENSSEFEVSPENITQLIVMLKEADRAILDVYHSSGFTVENKSDNSPLTEADKASHKIITRTLTNLFPEVPIISEEGDMSHTAEILQSDLFWLVDPLDGTKEFVNRNDEFTICVALVKNKRSIFGMISVPTKDTIYYSGLGSAFKKVGNNEAKRIHVATVPTGVVTVSRSHLSETTQRYVQENYPTSTMQQAGSSLKATLIAEGLADSYPTFDTGMSLWDLAASQAIIEAAGGIVERPNGDAVIYDAPDLKIGDFVAHR